MEITRAYLFFGLLLSHFGLVWAVGNLENELVWSEAIAYRYMPYLDVYVCHTGDVYIYTWTQNSTCSRRERWCI